MNEEKHIHRELGIPDLDRDDAKCKHGHWNTRQHGDNNHEGDSQKMIAYHHSGT